MGRESAVLFADLIGAQELYASAGDAPAHEAIAVDGVVVHGEGPCLAGEIVLADVPDLEDAALCIAAAPGEEGLSVGRGVEPLRRAGEIEDDRTAERKDAGSR